MIACDDILVKDRLGKKTARALLTASRQFRLGVKWSDMRMSGDFNVRMLSIIVQLNFVRYIITNATCILCPYQSFAEIVNDNLTGKQ